MTANEQQVTVPSADGTPITLWRSGSGPSLLVVHGTGADHSAWEQVTPLLADVFTVYAMDRRGRGASGDGPVYAVEREFEDVAAAVAALPGPVVGYGHSFGGMCVLEPALDGANLAALVLYEGGLKPPGLRFIPDELIDRLDGLIADGRAGDALTSFMLTAAGVTPAEYQVLRAAPSWQARVDATATIPRELRAANDYSVDPERLARLEIPVVLLAGGDTEPRRRQMFESLGARLPHARLVELPGQRHAAHHTAPQLLAATLRQALAEVPGPARSATP